jgi:methionine biosynthesis protein MetW
VRPDLEVVAGLVPAGARVLDLGCGDGALLAGLAAGSGCQVTGVENDEEAFLAAVARGVPTLSLDLDRDLGVFADGSYDVAVLSRTLQVTRNPAAVLGHVRRIAGRAVVSVPNFGHWRHRAAVLRGRMPVSPHLPHAWWATPNIHLSTLADLEDLFAAQGLAVLRRVALDGSGRPGRRALPGLLAAAAVYGLARTD